MLGADFWLAGPVLSPSSAFRLYSMTRGVVTSNGMHGFTTVFTALHDMKDSRFPNHEGHPAICNTEYPVDTAF